MAKTVSQKMGLLRGGRAYLVNAPESALSSIGLPAMVFSDDLDGAFDYIHLFTIHQSDMGRAFPALRDALSPGGMLWVSWPKGKQLGTDLSLPDVIRIGYEHGLVESKTVSINSVWSALKFTHPKPGKTYCNSFGQLPDR